MIEELENSMVDYAVFFYKSMLLFYDKWNHSSSDVIMRETDGFHSGMVGKPGAPHPSLIYQSRIFTYSDLLGNTSFTKATQKSTIFQSRSGRDISRSALNTGAMSTRSIKSVQTGAFKRGLILLRNESFFSTGWYIHYCILDRNILHLFTNQKEDSGIKEHINLVGSRVDPWEDSAQPNSFKLTDKEENSYIFAGSDKFDSEEWSNLIMLASGERDALPEINQSQPKAATPENGIPLNRVKEVKAHISQINGKNIVLLSVENGVRIFGPLDNPDNDPSLLQLPEKGGKDANSKVNSLLNTIKSNCNLILKETRTRNMLERAWLFFSRSSCCSTISSPFYRRCSFWGQGLL